MYKSLDYENPESQRLKCAVEIEVMLQDGLMVDMLTEEQIALYIDVYGLRSLERYQQNDTGDYRELCANQSDDCCSDEETYGNEEGGERMYEGHSVVP